MATTLRRISGHAVGKARRFLFLRFRKAYVERQVGLRQGDCDQCGNCCEILFRCPFLVKVEGGKSWCAIYQNRPNQCAVFPLDRKCLRDVGFHCSHTFGEADFTGAPQLLEIV